VQPGVLRHLDAAVLRGGQDRAGAAIRIYSQLGFPDAPALLAQAAASLDLLSSGRFELGIGPTDTNAWDAIEAMGGVQRTPAESVRALSEAIEIIRGIWNVFSPGMIRIGGKHYRVSDTMRGPQPAHNISIWVPAARRHIRQLVGRKADGWISERAWMTDVGGKLALGNRIIDEAATEAGRDPRDVRRIFDHHGSFGQARCGFLQDPPAQWVEMLLLSVIEHGGQHVHPGRGRPARNPAFWRRGHPGPTRGGHPRSAGGRDADQRGNKNKGSKERRRVIFALGNNRICFHKSIALPE
jgi:Luciferase-like monooxygenase